MRISVQDGDRAYVEPDQAQVRILLNGAEQRACVTADEELGYIVRYVLNEDGRLVVDPATDEERLECVYGTVSIGPLPGYEHVEPLLRRLWEKRAARAVCLAG